ncbi:MAG: tyrosine-type recombinase/integrase [Nitrososphaerota archaeon]
MIPRRRGTIDVFTLDDCVREYFNLNPQLIKLRQHYTLLRVLDFLRDALGVKSYSEILRTDAKSLITALQKFVNSCIEKGQSQKSIRFKLYLVRSFLGFYDIEINPKKIKIPRKAGRSRIDRIPTLAELQKLLMGTRSSRMRLAIMLMALCGLRISEALSVRREWIDLERGFLTLPAEATKIGKPREIPIPTELREELKRYLENYPHKRGYLFCAEGNPEKRIPKNRFYENYVNLLKRLGLDAKTPDGTAYQLHPHVFRKWYRTMLESAGVNKLLIDLWMGHNSGIEKHYYLPTPEIIKQEFEKADKALRIFGNVLQAMPQATEAKIAAVENALREREAEFRKKFEEKLKEFERIKERMEIYENTLKTILEKQGIKTKDDVDKYLEKFPF